MSMILKDTGFKTHINPTDEKLKKLRAKSVKNYHKLLSDLRNGALISMTKEMFEIYQEDNLLGPYEDKTGEYELKYKDNSEVPDSIFLYWEKR